MAKKIDTRDIDGLTVTCTQLPPRKAFKLGAKLVKYLAPAFANMGGIKPTDAIKALTPALVAMMRELDSEDLDAFAKEILSGTRVVVPEHEIDGKTEPMRKHDLVDPAQIDKAFEGRFASMLSCMKHALEVNFGDFFAETAAAPEAPADASVTTPAPAA